MKKRILSYLLVFLLALQFLSACGISEDKLEEAKEQAYREGYEYGYYRGTEEQREKDYEELLIDGHSIRTIVEEIYDEYGLTPSKAFSIVEDYEFDYTHGGYTWDEYQHAIEVIFATASVFPSDY